MFLIQMLLPTATVSREMPAHDHIARTRAELIEAFGGVTAYLRTPAQGAWTSPEGQREHDEVVMVEVVAHRFDREWWRRYADMLARRFQQDVIHVRAMQVEILDGDAV